MRILHLGDLHFGKRVDKLSLEDDQRFICSEIYKVIDCRGVEAVIISGDVYDKDSPSREAVVMFDRFLVELDKRHIPVLIIAGNHDSVERLSFGSTLLEAANVYISPQYDGSVRKVSLSDSFGTVNFFLLPFLKPVHVRRCFPEELIESYTDAIAAAIRHMDIDTAERNVILSHQFVTGAERDGSEDELYVGGTSNVDSSVYECFDYAALGHIHRPQAVADNAIRYCGSPMKYSFNEAEQPKGLTIVDILEKGHIGTEFIPLSPLRDFVKIKGSYDELKLGSSSVNPQDFVHVILTDEDDVPNAYSNLALVYPNILSLSYDNSRTRSMLEPDGGEIAPELKPAELFADFFMQRNNHGLDEEQAAYIENAVREIWEGRT